MKRITALTTTAIAAASLLPAGPAAHAVTTNKTFQNYTSGSVTSQYHIYANNIDWSKPVGAVFFFDGDYTDAKQTTVNNTNGTALKNIAKVANDRNMILIPVVSPDKHTGGKYTTWWEQKDSNGNWFRDFARTIIAETGVDDTNIWTLGQSGGSEFIASELSADSQDTWRQGGGDIMVGGGNTFGLQTAAPAGYTNIPQYWWIGENDNVKDSNQFGWSAYRAAIAGKASYEAAGFTNTHLTMVPGTNHFQYNHADILAKTLDQADHITWGASATAARAADATEVMAQTSSVDVLTTEEETFDPQAGYNAIYDYYWGKGDVEAYGNATDHPFFSINNGIVQNFEKSSIYWTAKSGAHAVKWNTGIGNYYASKDFEHGLGYPTTDEEEFFGGAVQRFSKSTAYWSAETGTHSLVNKGGITTKWIEAGDAAEIGFPTNDEKVAEDGSATVTFAKDGKKTTIIWTKDNGAHTIVEGGAIYQAWKANGGAAEHGYPVTDEEVGADGITRVTFSDGTTINWTEADGAWLTVG